MLKPSDLVDCAEDFAALFAQLDSDINSSITAHIAANKVGDTVKWQAEMKKHGKYVYRAVLNALKKINPKAAKVLKETYQKGVQKSATYPKEMQKLLKDTDFNPQEAQGLLTYVLAGVRKTNGLMSNLTMTLAQTAQNAFSNAMDRAYMQVLSGTFTQDQALRMAVRDLTEKGYQKIAYPSGTQTSVEVAARRAVVTGLNQTVAEVQLHMCEEFGTDLVEVSAHAGARPTHAVWQGKVYCINGATEKYGDFRTETGYGTGEGLCGWNCYHTFFPFIEGVTERSFSEDPSKEYLGKDNDTMYEQSQKQRAYERAVREAKKKCAALKSAIDNAESPELKQSLESDYAKAKKLVQTRTKRLKDYCKETGRTYYRNRTEIGGTGIKESKSDRLTAQVQKNKSKVNSGVKAEAQIKQPVPIAAKVTNQGTVNSATQSASSGGIVLNNEPENGIINAGTERKLLIGGVETESMPKEQLDRIARAFTKNGGVIEMNADCDRYLQRRGAEAITLNANTILLSTYSSRAAVFEELIHSHQWKTGELTDDPLSKAKAEVAAKEKLLKCSKVYHLTDGDVEITKRLLENDRKVLKQLLEGESDD